MCYTLQERLERLSGLRRSKYIYQVLCSNGICTMDDFIAKPIPSKGLKVHEIMALNKLRNIETAIHTAKEDAYKEMTALLSKYVRNNDAARIASVLKREDIWSLRLLASTPDEKLSRIYGIGPKSLDILKKVKRFLNTQKAHQIMNTGASEPGPSPFQPLLAY